MKKLIGGFFILCLIVCVSFISLNDKNETVPKTKISDTPIQKNVVEKQEKTDRELQRELLEEELGVKNINMGNLTVNEEITTKDE
ncbi:hypothetical protein [Lysinibacillus sphaericus]|uniref:hypothetical protein n=1 Tax=Lysinibacillus sphaericus TaxID=1421 RepID=UPI001A9D5FED|nr:hypothetical protein [Lysinibacillus sphaericus]QTB29510.1 hypothetical protein J2D51_23740 [Lysinibacillus sphaericus]